MPLKNIHLKLAELKSKVNEYNLTPEIRALFDTLIILIEILLQRQSKNSKNSSIPPSQDPNRIKNKSSAKGKKSGGQIGHKGLTLEKDPNPTEIIAIKLDRRSLPKGQKYINSEPETRQVKDFEVKVTIVEYQAEVVINEMGKRFVAEFPANVNKAVQYGSNIKSNAVYMSHYQMCSLDRIEDNFLDQLNIKLSEGSIHNFSLEFYKKLMPWNTFVKENLISQNLLHADETGINVNSDNYWLHVLCNAKFTLFFAHSKRGKEAMDEMGVLPYFKGYLCHDHWKPYFSYLCTHVLCNAHHLRELVYIEEVEKQIWAKKMREFLILLNEEVKAKGGSLSVPRQKEQIKNYFKILKDGEKECPIAKAVKGKRGRTKQSKSRNLLDRFKEFEKEILNFMRNKTIPFTNNQGENDLRMTKVKLKVAGCFRSFLGAQIFASIRGFINTCKKNNINTTDAIKAVFDNKLDEIINKIQNYTE
jgi:transposase